MRRHSCDLDRRLVCKRDRMRGRVRCRGIDMSGLNALSRSARDADGVGAQAELVAAVTNRSRRAARESCSSRSADHGIIAGVWQRKTAARAANERVGALTMKQRRRQSCAFYGRTAVNCRIPHRAVEVRSQAVSRPPEVC